MDSILIFSPIQNTQTNSTSNWSEWVASTACCGGFQTKVRTCESGSRDACAGPSELKFTCSPEDDSCGNGGWSEWENATACCERIQVQTRTCLETTCEGSSSQVIVCSRADVCYSASTTTCTVADPFFSSTNKLYETIEECCATEFSASNSTCLSVDAGVDDGWTEWSNLTVCCNNRQFRNRTCTNPDGDGCVGLALEEVNCSPNTCNDTTLEDGWSEFSNWTECCDGMQTRFRTCNNTDVDGSVLECSGEAMDNQTCFPDTCTPVVNGNWSDWGAWSDCCYGVQSRNRTCDNPAPEAGGSDCQGEPFQETGCSLDICRETVVVANWSEWGDWGPCCNGTHQRFRVCENPLPTNASDSCQGLSMEEETCSTNTCHVASSNSSGWGEFGEWSGCCFGTQKRVRACENPPCTGPFFEEQECIRDDGLQQCFYPIPSTRQCAIIADIAVQSTVQSYFENMESCCQRHFPTAYKSCMVVDQSAPEISWGNWTEWNACCFGKQSRYRSCLKDPCEGTPVEERTCAPDACGLEDPFSDSSTTTTSEGVQSLRSVSVLHFLSLTLMAIWYLN